MTVYPQQNNTFSQNPNSLGYDLELEKQLIAEGTGEIKKELLEKWKIKYADAEIFPPILSDFNPALIDFLLSFQHTLFYNELGQKFNFNQEQRSVLLAIVWNICKNKRWETMENSLQTDLNLSPQISGQIASLVNQKILFKAKELASQPFVSRSNKTTPVDEINSRVSIVLSEALRIYPETGEQLVTSNKINLRSFPYPVRPSIKNWLADYTFNLGYEKHESMERSNYLFQGINTKNLSAPEKNKLAYLLKSFDENSPVTLNKNTKQVIWPARNVSHSDAGGPANENNLPKNLSDQFRPTTTPQTEQKNINAMEFSYRQKLPYEKTLPASAPTKTSSQNFPDLSREIPTENRGVERISRNEPQKFSPKPVSSQNLTKNVVDLKNINQ
jgi:hypothetical protein